MHPDTPLLPILRDEIRACGPLSFHRFMELCLYHPQHGYYNSARVKLGAAGDFYTSAHLAPVFARLLARHFVEVWHVLGDPSPFDLVELGPGDGLLACELLPWMNQRFPELSSCVRYTGIEQSSPLRDRLEQRLQFFAGRTRILENLPAPAPAHGGEGFQGCIFANEFFDALPVHLLVWRGGRWQERYVSLEREKLAWVEGPPSLPSLAKEAELYFDSVLAREEREEGWMAEIRPLAAPWMQKLGQCLSRGELIVVDYGYTLEEWRQGRFPTGSALAYRRHQVGYDLLAHPGDQDMTAHVNVSQLIDAGRQSGFAVRSLQSQEKFLMEIGQEDEFGDLFADCFSDAERLHRAQLLKTLLLPQGMGEAFRVLVLEKNPQAPVPGI